VTRRGHIKKAYLIALLCGGSAIPAIGWTHWEGFEAADPATAAALLTFDSAVGRYTPLDTEPLPWRSPIDGDGDSDSSTAGEAAGASPHSGHAGAAPTDLQ
jgi:hypothetical protein